MQIAATAGGGHLMAFGRAQRVGTPGQPLEAVIAASDAPAEDLKGRRSNPYHAPNVLSIEEEPTWPSKH